MTHSKLKISGRMAWCETYRGFTLEAHADVAIGGFTAVHWFAIRRRDQYELIKGTGFFSTPMNAVAGLKRSVDHFRDKCGSRVSRWEKVEVKYG